MSQDNAGNIIVCAAVKQNGFLHCCTMGGPCITANIIKYVDRPHNIITAENQMDAEQMRYIFIWDNVSFHTQLIFKSMFIAIFIASMSCYQMEIASLS